MRAKSAKAGFEKIAGAANGLQETRIFGIGFDFFAQAADADVHAAQGEELFAAPDGGDELLAGEDAAGVRSEVIEKAEFEQAGGDVFVGAGDAVGVEMDAQMVEFEGQASCGGRFGAPEKKFDAGDKFARAERFGDVIVSARFKGGEEVFFAAAGGEHDDGEAMKQRILAGFGEDLEAGNAGKHGIEEEEMGSGLFQGGAAGEAVCGFGDVETGFA